MPTPLNAIAETITKLRLDAESTTAVIAYQQQQLAATEATIAELEPLAEWGPDPVEPNPTA